MANKKYISPIRLFKLCDISFTGEINVARIKKQLVAEFDFKQGGLLETDGFTFNKSDVTEELGRTDFEARLYYHKLIWNRKALLAFLEEDARDTTALFDDLRTFANDKGFEDFVSPYFTLSFNTVMTGLLHPPRFAEAADWLRCEDFVQPADREEGFRSLRVFLEESIRLFKNLNADTYRQKRSDMLVWVRLGWAQFLNALPDDLYEEKVDLVLALINFTVRIQKTSKADCREISLELTTLDNIPKEYSDLIYNNHLAYTQQSTSPRSFGANYGWIIWVILVLARLLVKC